MRRAALFILAGVLAAGSPASAQVGVASAEAPTVPVASSAGRGEFNPIRVLDAAGALLDRRYAGEGGPEVGPPRPGGAGAEGRGGLSAVVNILVLLTVISLAPSIMLMTTCFLRVVVVLGLLKQAIGAQTIPPPQVTVALALFMTALVMTPTLDRMYAEAIGPYQRGEITDHGELWDRVKQPMRDFMFAQIEATGNWSSLYMVMGRRGYDVSDPSRLTRADVDMVTLVPAFMLSELKTAFLMGFRIYLPFLVIDMVVSSVLISMSMMMLPPVLVSLPFKLLLFVLVDGWQLVVGSLMRTFA